MVRRFADLAVASEVPFSDLPAATQPPDITIRRAALAQATGNLIQQWAGTQDRAWLSIRHDAGGYRVSLPDLECRISSDGRDVSFDAAAAVSGELLVHLLLHQVLPLAVSRIGRFVLHACAVETPSGAVGFIGESGAGKSTLAAAFCRRGFALVADDALVVDVRGDMPSVWPTADGIRLWHDMRDAAPAGAAIVPTGAGKLRAPVRIAAGPAPLARLYRLDASEDGAVETRPLPAAAVRIEMLSHLFRLDVGDRAESRRLFDAANRAAAAVPARALLFPDGIEHLDAAVDLILRDLERQ